MASKTYKAIISSDWSECLSPNGPFDFIRFTCPNLTGKLSSIFRQYTGNQITLGEVNGRIKSLLPEQISSAQMDAYLEAEFKTYTGVPGLIEWCRSREVLFVINTTGMIGYFQRVFAKKLLPPVEVLSANSLVRYQTAATDPAYVLELFEIQDKGRNTAAVAKTLGIKPGNIVIIGDSGGDGPHFEWGSGVGATLVGSMTKKSLDDYCREKQIHIQHRIGTDFSRVPAPGGQDEPESNLMDLCDILVDRLQV